MSTLMVGSFNAADASGYPVFQAGTLVRQRDDGIWEYAKPQAHSLPNDNCLPLVEM
jgi:hypothetical protein